MKQQLIQLNDDEFDIAYNLLCTVLACRNIVQVYLETHMLCDETTIPDNVIDFLNMCNVTLAKYNTYLRSLVLVYQSDLHTDWSCELIPARKAILLKY